MINLDEVPERCESPDEGSATFVPQAQEENSSSREISNSCTNRLRSNRPIILIVVFILVVFGVICILKILIYTVTCSLHEEHARQLNMALNLSLGKIAQLQEERKQLDAQLRESSVVHSEKLQRHQSILFSNRLSILWSLCNKETFECSRCLPGWIEHGSSCFFLSKDIKNWEEARVECRKMGGDLVVLRGYEDQAFLTNLTYEYSLQDTNFHSAWIGLQDLVNERTFVWVNGSKLRRGFNYWKPGSLNNAQAPWDTHKRGQDCVAILPTSGSSQEWYNNWDDITCVGSRHYLCESTPLILF